MFFDISTEETLHAINMHVTTVRFCNECLRDKLPSFLSFDFFNKGSINVVCVILLQEALSSNLNKIILIVRIIAACLHIAGLRELLSKVWIILLLLMLSKSSSRSLIRTQQNNLVVVLNIFRHQRIVSAHHAFIIGCRLWSIDHHVECLVHYQLLWRVIRWLVVHIFFLLVLLRCLLSVLRSAFRPDKPILLVSNFRCYSILKLLIYDTLLLLCCPTPIDLFV